MSESMHKLIEDRKELLDAALDLDGEITEEVAVILESKDQAITKKMDTFHFVIKTLGAMIDQNKEKMNEIKYVNERLALAKASLHKAYYGHIKHNLEVSFLNTSSHKYLPKISKRSEVDHEKLKDEDMFLEIKVSKKDWDSLSKKPATKLSKFAEKIILIKEKAPLVSELPAGHPAKVAALTEYIQIRPNTNKLDNTKDIE